MNESREPKSNASVDDRSPMAKAVEKASEVTTIAFMMVVPALPGYWLDLYLGTLPLFAIVGLILGMVCGIWQLIRLVNRSSGRTGSNSVLSDGDEKN